MVQATGHAYMPTVLGLFYSHPGVAGEALSQKSREKKGSAVKRRRDSTKGFYEGFYEGVPSPESLGVDRLLHTSMWLVSVDQVQSRPETTFPFRYLGSLGLPDSPGSFQAEHRFGLVRNH